MSIDHTRCYVVTCDTCRTTFDETGADYVVHFDTPDEAIGYITEHGWTLTTDGHPRCDRCTPAATATATATTTAPGTPATAKATSQTTPSTAADYSASATNATTTKPPPSQPFRQPQSHTPSVVDGDPYPRATHHNPAARGQG
jgi:hypothetical protein